MKHVLGAGFLTVAVLSSFGCSTMSVRTDYDTQVDFAGYSTFAMFDRPGKESNRPQMSPIVDRRIVAAMGADLEGKGFESARVRESDFMITFYTAVRRRVSVHHAGYYGYRWRYWRWGSTHVHSYDEGTLVIDIIDSRRRDLVWRGVGEGAFGKSNPSDEKVAKVVAKILASFPPTADH
jgi:hypothetical protein